MKRPDAGFSLIELIIVLVVLLIISTIAIPAIRVTINNYRLDAAGHAVASLLQQARLQAVKTNQSTYAQYDTTKSPNLAFVNSDPTVAYVNGNPDAELTTTVSFQAAGMPNHAQLDAYVGAGTEIQIGTSIGFNARGLPCMADATNVLRCLQINPATGGTRSFEWFVQSSSNQGWEAITVTAAGRIKTWRFSGFDAANTRCGYAACWN